jgi:hypothetical protein
VLPTGASVGAPSFTRLHPHPTFRFRSSRMSIHSLLSPVSAGVRAWDLSRTLTRAGSKPKLASRPIRSCSSSQRPKHHRDVFYIFFPYHVHAMMYTSFFRRQVETSTLPASFCIQLSRIKALSEDNMVYLALYKVFDILLLCDSTLSRALSVSR